MNKKIWLKLTRSESSKSLFWNFSGMAFSLLTGVITARMLSPDDRGILALSVTLASLSFIFSSFGTNIAIRTFQPKEEWASFRTYLQVSLRLLGVDLFIAIIFAAFYILIGTIQPNLVVLFVLLLSVTNFISSQFLDILNAAGKISSSAMVNTIGYAATLLGLTVGLFFNFESHLNFAIFSYTLGFATRAILVVILFRKHSLPLGDSFSGAHTRLTREGLKFWGMNLGQTITLRIDQILLAALSTAHQVGIYAIAVTPASLMRVASNSIAQIQFRKAAVGILTKRELLKSLMLALSITVSYVVVMWLSAPFLIPLVFGSAYQESVKIVQILLIGEVFLCPYLIFVRVLAGFNHPKVASCSGFIGLASIFPIMLYLVPKYGSVGAAIGMTISYLCMLCWVSAFIIKFAKTDLNRA